MIGGTGNDIYVIDNLGDKIVEHPGEGTDTAYVYTSGYTLDDNVEIGGVGTATGLTLSGNSGDNCLWGNTGDDTLIGGAGNDFLLAVRVPIRLSEAPEMTPMSSITSATMLSRTRTRVPTRS